MTGYVRAHNPAACGSGRVRSWDYIVIGLLVTVLALGSRPYRELSSRYAAAPTEVGPEEEVEVPAA